MTALQRELSRHLFCGESPTTGLSPEKTMAACILFVDPDPDVRELCSRYMRRLGFETCRDQLGRIEGRLHPPDVIVLEPEYLSPERAKRVADLDVPVVLLSRMSVVPISCDVLRVVASFEKPVELSLLAQTLRKTVTRRQFGASDRPYTDRIQAAITYLAQ